MSISAILLAGGVGRRMGSDVPKQFLPLGDRLIIHHSLQQLITHPLLDDIVVVCDARYHSLVTDDPHIRFASPGERRQDSLYQGLKIATGEWILVHDAARPFVSQEQITRVIAAGQHTGAALLAKKATGTIKHSTRESLVDKTLDRNTLWEAQTPQIVSRQVLELGFKIAQHQERTVTDDAELAELAGACVALVEGSAYNFKVTTLEDYALAKALYATL